MFSTQEPGLHRYTDFVCLYSQLRHVIHMTVTNCKSLSPMLPMSMTRPSGGLLVRGVCDLWQLVILALQQPL